MQPYCGARERATRAGKSPSLRDCLAGATVLCVGRGGSYPALSVALGERVGLIGAFSVETATRYLDAREIDGVVIGDGLGPRGVEALLTELAEKFRDLPVGMLNNNACDEEDSRISSVSKPLLSSWPSVFLRSCGSRHSRDISSAC